MIAGWDQDGDHQYPPFDRDDQAELSGRRQGAGPPARQQKRRFRDRPPGLSGYGTETESRDSGLVQFGPSQGEVERIHFHDLHLIGLNQERVTSSEVSTFDLFPGKALLRHLWVENVWAPQERRLVRPRRRRRYRSRQRALPFREDQPRRPRLRFLELRKRRRDDRLPPLGQTVRHRDPRLLLRRRRQRLGAQTQGGPQGAAFAVIAQCSQGWTIRGNEIQDYKVFVKLQGWIEKYCDNANAQAGRGRAHRPQLFPQRLPALGGRRRRDLPESKAAKTPARRWAACGSPAT